MSNVIPFTFDRARRRRAKREATKILAGPRVLRRLELHPIRELDEGLRNAYEQEPNGIADYRAWCAWVLAIGLDAILAHRKREAERAAAARPVTPAGSLLGGPVVEG